MPSVGMSDRLTIVPRFLWTVRLWSNKARVCYLICWFSFAFALAYGLWDPRSWWPVALYFSAAFCIPVVPLLFALYGKYTYQRTQYVVTPDHIEIESGLFVRQRKVLHFSDLGRVLLEQNFMQRRNGIASVALVSKAVPTVPVAWLQKIVDHGFVANAPRLQDVSNPSELFDTLNRRRTQTLR